MAEQTYGAFSDIGKQIAEGIETYSKNQKNSEAADATIASGLARFKSISSVWGKDPEFAPIVQQFAERLKQYENAPSLSYAKKAVAANEIGLITQELGETLQAYQVVRKREVERVGGDILAKFPTTSTVSDPAFVAEGVNSFKTDRDYSSNEGEFIAGVKRFREAAKSAGKEIKGTDAEAIDAYRRNVVDSTNKAMTAGTLDKAVGSRIIEQVEAQRQNDARAALVAKANAEGRGLTLAEAVDLFKGDKVVGEYKAVTTPIYQAEKSTPSSKSDNKPSDIAAPAREQISKELDALLKREKALKDKAKENEEQQKSESILGGGKSPARKALESTAKKVQDNVIIPLARHFGEKYSKVNEQGEVSIDFSKLLRDGVAAPLTAAVMANPIAISLTQSGVFDEEKPLAERVKIANEIQNGFQKASPEAELADVQSRIKGLQRQLTEVSSIGTSKPAEANAPKMRMTANTWAEAAAIIGEDEQTARWRGERLFGLTPSEYVQEYGQLKPTKAGSVVGAAPQVSLGRQAVGSVEYERKVNLAEKKAKVAELLTERIGVTDPATGKKTLPAGFDSWFKQMVPESDLRVVDVDGLKLLWNGKGFEQIKIEQPKAPTPKEIGENSAFVFGVQTEKGIQPVELVPDSGVLIGGIVSGSTAGAEKVREQLTDMIDLRSSVSRLTAINDKFGESLSLRDQGISQYDLMKLRAVLTKQVNVSGSISDYERKAIEKMTPDPTAFLDFEPKTRAALLGIALGLDRDIKTLATSRGLTVIMQENGGKTQNQSLRQKYLSGNTK